MPGLPIAGKDSTIGDAYEYGQFQNFLPTIKAEGQNDMATGLRPEMFGYTKPSGANPEADALPTPRLAAAIAAGSGGGGGGGGGGSGGPAHGSRARSKPRNYEPIRHADPKYRPGGSARPST